MSAAGGRTGQFPRRAYLQSFDGEVQPDVAPLLAELRERGVPVETHCTEAIIARPLPLTKEDLVVGDFDWTRRALRQLKVVMPEPPDYPACLTKYLHRRVWESTLGEVQSELASASSSSSSASQVFIKPAADTKVFSAIIEPKDQMLDMLIHGLPGAISPLPASTPVHCAEVVEMVSEYRVYVVRGEIRCIAHYLGPDDGKLDRAVVEEAVRAFAESDEALAGCGMDFAVMKKRQKQKEGRKSDDDDDDDDDDTHEGDDGATTEYVTCLIEVNDGYSLGVYKGLSGKDHADLLIARWQELMAGA